MTTVEVDVKIGGPHTFLIEYEWVNAAGVKITAPADALPLTLKVRATPVDRCDELLDR